MTGTGFEIAVDRANDLVTVRYLGMLTLDVAKRALDAAAAVEGVSPATLVLLDTTRALVHEIDIDWLRRYQAYKAERGYPLQITALVASGEESHQVLGQLWAAMRATASMPAPGVFTDAAAATRWLLERRSLGGSQSVRA